MSSESCSAPNCTKLGTYHELNIALPTAGSKTGRTIRKCHRPEKEEKSKRTGKVAMGSGGYDELDDNRDHRLLTHSGSSFFYANLEYLALLGSRT